ncbi:MAG: DNA-processing protein DprA [Casimicrobiaceae bacterium]
MPLLDDELLWLRLALTPGVGTRTAHGLLAEFGGVGEIFGASERALAQRVGARVAHAIKADPSPEVVATLEATRVWLTEDAHHLLTWADARYPKPLLELADAPLVLFANGRLDRLEHTPAIAIVGSRNASAGGCDDARAFARALALAGVCIVSGLALGIDGAAHQGALDAGETGAGTIAVVGTGLDRVYPPKHRALAHAIAERGLLLSEFPLGTPPRAENFPRRNRIISGLVRAVLVVEATLKSGSLITARLAAEQGRDVFAMPGSIHSIHHKGCHALIKQGAKLVESAADILEELGIGGLVARQPSAPVSASPEVDDLLGAALGYDPVDLDTLIARSKRSSAEVLAALTMLELEGKVEQLPGGRWQRRSSA